MRAALALLLIAALAAVGLAVVRPALRDEGAGAGSGASGAAALQQAINGPVSPESIVRQPLNVDLKATRDPVQIDFHDPPRSGLLFDLDTGQVLWRRDPERVLPIASLTKMMTALVVVAHSEPSDRVRVTKEALAYQGSGIGVLPHGGKLVNLETMLNGMLIVSGNDAAIALSQRIGGTQGHFVKMMNDQAREMGLPCSRFARPDGYQDAGNHSCAADLAAIARAVLDQPRLARIVKQRKVVLPFPIKGGKLWLYAHNPIVVSGYPGATGIKTGFTDAAGECIVATATRHGRRLGRRPAGLTGHRQAGDAAPERRLPCRAPLSPGPGPASSEPRGLGHVDLGDDQLAVGGQGGVLGVVLQVERELVDAERLELVQARDLVLGRSDQAEAVDDLVGHELGVGVAGLAVLVVVVALAAGDVVGQRLGDGGAVGPVAADDVGDVVADHAAEPAALVARVLQMALAAVGHVGGRGDADRHRVGSRPAAWAAARTAPIDHCVIAGSASWRMNPSPISPVSASIFGP